MREPTDEPDPLTDSDPMSDEDDDGVDVSLIRWVLSLSVAERLALLQRQAASLAKLRDAASER